MRRVCVFCGSSPGRDPRYTDAARRLGQALVHRGLGLVYGGASVGLMGTIANTVLDGGGEAIGVIPRALDAKEITHPSLTEQHVVGSMHKRKALMAKLADGFIALPGGWGTFEELFEALTWAQLGFHAKPCGLLNAAGYYDRLAAFLQHAEEEAFVRPEFRPMLIVSGQADELLDQFEAYRAPSVPKWITAEET